MIPSLATAKGWPARMARGSTIVAAIERWAPTQPARFAAWGRAISDAPYPSALGPLQSPPNPGPPPGTSITAGGRRACARVDRDGHRATRATRSKRGAAGSRRRASSSRTRTSSRGSARPPCHDVDGRGDAGDRGRVRSRARRRGARRCPRSPAPAARRWRTGAVGERRRGLRASRAAARSQASPARVGDEILAVGTDIYRTGIEPRHVYVLAAALAPGDSGGALVNRERRGHRHGVRDRSRPERDRLRAHRRRDPAGAAPACSNARHRRRVHDRPLPASS